MTAFVHFQHCTNAFAFCDFFDFMAKGNCLLFLFKLKKKNWKLNKYYCSWTYCNGFPLPFPFPHSVLPYIRLISRASNGSNCQLIVMLLPLLVLLLLLLLLLQHEQFHLEFKSYLCGKHFICDLAFYWERHILQYNPLQWAEHQMGEYLISMWYTKWSCHVSFVLP